MKTILMFLMIIINNHDIVDATEANQSILSVHRNNVKPIANNFIK